MSANSKLSISIPTYNRASFLDENLRLLIPLVRKHKVEINVFDNASNDHTEAVIKKWQKSYPYLKCSRNDVNLGWGKNFELALKVPETDYVWLLGDTYKISDQDSIEYVVLNVTECYVDAYVFNLDSIISRQDKNIVNADELLGTLSGVLSCVSCTVFSKKIINSTCFERYVNTSFLHTGVLLEYCGSNEFNVEWIGSRSVLNITLPELVKSNWSERADALTIGCLHWLNLIFSLPCGYSVSAKLVAGKEFGIVSGLLTVRGFIKLRANKVLCLNFVRQNSMEISLASKVPYYLILVLSVLPARLCKVVVLLGGKLKGG